MAIAPKKPARTVIKFGGSSLATSKRLLEVANLVKLLIDQGQMPTMVCSAMGKTTNNLLNAGDFALRDGKVTDGDPRRARRVGFRESLDGGS